MKSIKKLVMTLTLSAALVFPMVSPQPGNPTVVSAATIKINTKSCTIVKGKSKTLSILGTKKKVTWKSSKSSVATVSSKGKVTAKKAGTTTITATVNKMKYTCRVTVKNPNKYIATAPYKAVERTVGDINFVVPKDWTFENMQEISGTSVAILFPKSTENSNVILTCEKTGTDALDFASLKETMDGSYNAEIIKQTFSSVFGTEDIVVQDFTSGEFKTKYGSAYKAAYTLIIPKGIQLDELDVSLDVANTPDTTTTEPITLKQAIYTIYMDNYSITIVSTDMDNKNIEAVTDYVMKTFTLDK